MIIPSSFISKRIHLSWSDVLWGYQRQMLGWSAVVNLAEDRAAKEPSDPLEIELASLQKSEAHQVGGLLEQWRRKNAPLTKIYPNRSGYI